MKKENARLKEIVANLVFRNDIVKKSRHAELIDKYRKYMQLSAGEKYEIIRTVMEGEIERYHRTMKNVVKLNRFYHPEQLKEALTEFVNNYNEKRYHEALQNLTPADVYFGRTDQILRKREQVKINSISRRRQLYNQQKLLNL